uniref:50S ribosomal protein L21 n=1 Tax=Laurencia catarinensis TaxID=197326 RepID=UPI0028D25083|nr:50S ribosomal protein L21 [Laurencia catarinensis]WMP12392.1 50S ribosomal protein L21 [Laurencia catarinensis]
MVYAVVELGGNQIIVEPGKFYDVNYVPADPGDIINLNRVLLFAQSENFHIGYPCLNNVIVKAKVLRHLKGKKLTVFKVKPKKNNRVKMGHRQKLTRILIEKIFV